MAIELKPTLGNLVTLVASVLLIAITIQSAQPLPLGVCTNVRVNKVKKDFARPLFMRQKRQVSEILAYLAAVEGLAAISRFATCG